MPAPTVLVVEDDPTILQLLEVNFEMEGYIVLRAEDGEQGLAVDEAKAATIDWLEGHGTGEGTVQYKLRDWLFARQRYWGEPFPVVYDADGVPHALPDEMLPVELPEVED